MLGALGRPDPEGPFPSGQLTRAAFHEVEERRFDLAGLAWKDAEVEVDRGSVSSGVAHVAVADDLSVRDRHPRVRLQVHSRVREPGLKVARQLVVAFAVISGE